MHNLGHLTHSNRIIKKGNWIIIIFLQIVTLGNLFGQEREVFSGDSLPDTQLLSASAVESLPARMLHGTKLYFEQAANSSTKMRTVHWNQSFQSHKEYLHSIVANRNRFKKIIGVVDERDGIEESIFKASMAQKILVAETKDYNIYSIHWPVLEGVSGVGLWLEPHGKIQAQVVAIPDAAWTPEMLIGLDTGVPPEAQFARRLAAAGCRVVIPVLMNREDTWSGNPEVRMTNQTHREFIYRRAYEVGRHIIGYEVQKVLAVIDRFTEDNRRNRTNLPIAVAGYGEGGLLAFYSAAIDQRIDGTLVSGYFQEREEIWKEPIYRNIWGLLREFGDAEIASLIAPRQLVIEASKGPIVNGPPVPTGNRVDVATPGRLKTPPLESVLKEADRAKEVFQKLEVSEKIKIVVNDKGTGLPGSTIALQQLLSGIGVEAEIPPPGRKQLRDQRSDFNPGDRLHNQFVELLQHLNKIIKQSSGERERFFWDEANFSSSDPWVESTESYSEYLWEEIIGKMPSPSQALNPRTRLAYETPNWRGYRVELDVWPQIMAAGMLLIPKDIQSGEQRPLVVCEHGLGGQPELITNPDIESVYNSFGAKLADQGYVVYAPQSLYGLMPEQPYGERDFRVIQRMTNPLKKSLFSVTIGQHQQTLKWLKQLPFVDEQHIGFYGLSYGGKAAMRIPAVLKDYSVVISSGDFNEWVWKTTSLDFEQSYMFLPEYDMYEFDLGNKLSYAEMAGLIAPRPFMVERGHWDPVAPDEWVAYEYAKVRRLYDRLGIGDRTTIEFFNGPHEIHGVGTFEFLNKFLKLSEKNDE